MSFQYSENRFSFGLIRKSEVSLVISEKNCAKSKFFYSDKNICCQEVFFIVVVEQHRAKLPAREYNRTTILKNEIEKFRKKM